MAHDRRSLPPSCQELLFTGRCPVLRHLAAGNVDPPSLLTLPEAAERLSVSRTEIYRLVSAGRIPSVRIGRARRIRAQALERFIARNTETLPP